MNIAMARLLERDTSNWRKENTGTGGAHIWAGKVHIAYFDHARDASALMEMVKAVRENVAEAENETD